MDAKKVFLAAWLKLAFWSTAIALVIALVIITIGVIYHFFLTSLLIAFAMIILPAIVIVIVRWLKRVVVQAKHELVYEWCGEVLEPIKPSIVYPFDYFNFLSDGTLVPMNHQTLFILSGERSGLSQKDIDQFIYGSDTNVEPADGDYVRLKYGVEIECQDSIKLIYEKTDAYSFIAGLVEMKVIIFIKTLSNEGVNDGFAEPDWGTNLITDLAPQILSEVGVKLLKFFPIDVMNTLETEKSRSEVGMERRKGQVLKEKLENIVNYEKPISAEKDTMRTKTLTSIKTEAGVNGLVALKFINEQKKLETIATASQKGNITYMDDSGHGKLNDSFTTGWGFNAFNNGPKSLSSKKDVDIEQDDDNNNQIPKKIITINKRISRNVKN